jgi:hypothetical protein
VSAERRRFRFQPAHERCLVVSQQEQGGRVAQTAHRPCVRQFVLGAMHENVEALHGMLVLPEEGAGPEPAPLCFALPPLCIGASQGGAQVLLDLPHGCRRRDRQLVRRAIGKVDSELTTRTVAAAAGGGGGAHGGLIFRTLLCLWWSSALAAADHNTHSHDWAHALATSCRDTHLMAALCAACKRSPSEFVDGDAPLIQNLDVNHEAHHPWGQPFERGRAQRFTFKFHLAQALLRAARVPH